MDEAVQNKVVKELVLNFTLDEVNVLLAGLGELPAKVSLSLIDKIKKQATEQLSKETVVE